MYRFIPHKEIDKNKWNGAVHYAHNGNVYGYQWYLNAVLREWDAVVEDDYESVMPIISTPLHDGIYDLIPQLGPYSVNVLHTGRIREMVDVAIQHGSSAIYPLNNSIQPKSLRSYKTKEKAFSTFTLSKEYDDLSSAYSKGVFQEIHGVSKDHLSFTSGLKPELLVSLTNYPSVKKNALMRVMYNAMQRGIGFSNGIKLKENDTYLAASYFIASHNRLHEIFTMPGSDKSARRLMMDLVIRNGAGKPMSIQAYNDLEVLKEMGFKNEISYKVDLRNTFSKIKKAIKMPY